MDYLDKIIEKIKSFARKLVEILVGPEMEPDLELIPIPVRDKH
ncbi:MAG: DNA topoisomerase I [Acaryochloris sp. RU_4_1]|nr:DNA topoisomerase I [Acaryochloris sp. SU_5_25]NJM67891.1 DNA topoisomerase I [Acaryochloris sp. RU_4_1]NJN38010.1 DNA topoisomerase I [Acaryochloridaceae cyanobacterium CSU_3_4]NJR56612.1 DNA topoisomerase I [Acaryochloris sp. CRU_2_0]